MALEPLYPGSPTLSALLSDPDVITDPTAPRYGHSASGYGGKIPTQYRVKYLGRVRRVYAMCYSNAGSTYIIVNGETQFLDLY